MNGKLRDLFYTIIKWAWNEEDSCRTMARTIIGAARDAGLTSAELREALEWHAAE